MQRIVVVGLITITLIGGYYLYTRNNTSRIVPNISDPVVTATQGISLVGDKEEVDRLEQGGSSYLDKEGVFTILYPNNYTLDEMNEGEIIRIYMQGATQKGQTEIYDGVVITFQVIQLNNATLEAYVDSKIIESTADGTSELIAGKKNLSVNEYKGFTYTTRGLGESVNYVIQKDQDSEYAVSISTLVADPENVGFQKEVDSTISTIKFLK